jgi:hypothetical protein
MSALGGTGAKDMAPMRNGRNFITRDAFVMAFNDALLAVTIGLIVSAIAVWFCSKLTMEAAGAAGVSIDCRCQKVSND